MMAEPYPQHEEWLVNRWLLIAQDKINDRSSMLKVETWDNTYLAIADETAKQGDIVVLWRRGSSGGIVAVGEISSIKPIEELRFKEGSVQSVRMPGITKVGIVLNKLFMSNPLTVSRLNTAGFEGIVQKSRTVRDGYRSPNCAKLDLDDGQWKSLMGLIDTPRLQEWPAAWNISLGSVVSRTELHSVYGGSPRTPASSSGRTPNTLLFVRRTARDLNARWSGQSLIAPGHSQKGESISQENLAILGHLRRGRPLRVFEAKGNECMYLGEFAIDQDEPVERWVMTGEQEVNKLLNVVWDKQVPLLRLNPLDSARPALGGKNSFEEAPRISLRLLPSSHEASAMIRQLLTVLEREPIADLPDFDGLELLTEAVELQRRRTRLQELREVVEDASSTELDIHAQLKGQAWIFGGRYIEELTRQRFTTDSTLDIPLLRGDGALHVVELKRANIEKLIERPRVHPSVGSGVHLAFVQAANYLRALDENRATIFAEFGIDCRRAFSTVVIGHPKFVSSQYGPDEISAAFRTYNSHLSRIEVITYQELLDSAERALNLKIPSSSRED